MIITMIPLRETISKNFIRIMDAHPDIGATDIAKAVGVHRSMIYKWRDGVNVPDPDHMEGLAKLFGVDVMEFYKSASGSVTMHPSRALKKYLVIPDEVVELASQLDPDQDYVWREIIETIEIALMQKKLGKKN